MRNITRGLGQKLTWISAASALLLASTASAGTWKQSYQQGRKAFQAGNAKKASAAFLSTWRTLPAARRSTKAGLTVLMALSKSLAAAGNHGKARKVRGKGYQLAARLLGKNHPKVRALAATLRPAKPLAVVAAATKATPPTSLPSQAALDAAIKAVDDATGAEGWPAALRTIRTSAKGGSAVAARSMGTAYRLGRGVRIDHEVANQWFAKSAEAGDVASHFHLGLAAQTGLGRDVSDKDAIEHYQIAASEGFQPAQANLGELMLASDNKAVVRMGVRWVGVAAQAGYPIALGRLGDLYREGFKGVVVPDPKRAYGLYGKAAEAGLARAHYNLGVFLESGLGGVEADLVAAERHYRQAEELGFSAGNV